MLQNQVKTKQKYTFKQFKKFGVHKATIYRCLKKIEQKAHMENQNGLQSIQEILNELIFMFVIESCQKIEYDALFMMIFIPVSYFGDQPLELKELTVCIVHQTNRVPGTMN